MPSPDFSTILLKADMAGELLTDERIGIIMVAVNLPMVVFFVYDIRADVKEHIASVDDLAHQVIVDESGTGTGTGTSVVNPMVQNGEGSERGRFGEGSERGRRRLRLDSTAKLKNEFLTSRITTTAKKEYSSFLQHHGIVTYNSRRPTSPPCRPLSQGTAALGLQCVRRSGNC